MKQKKKEEAKNTKRKQIGSCSYPALLHAFPTTARRFDVPTPTRHPVLSRKKKKKKKNTHRHSWLACLVERPTTPPPLLPFHSVSSLLTRSSSNMRSHRNQWNDYSVDRERGGPDTDPSAVGHNMCVDWMQMAIGKQNDPEHIPLSADNRTVVRVKRSIQQIWTSSRIPPLPPLLPLPPFASLFRSALVVVSNAVRRAEMWVSGD